MTTNHEQTNSAALNDFMGKEKNTEWNYDRTRIGSSVQKVDHDANWKKNQIKKKKKKTLRASPTKL